MELVKNIAPNEAQRFIGVWEGYAFASDGKGKFLYKITIEDEKSGTIWLATESKRSHALYRINVIIQNNKLECRGIEFIENVAVGQTHFSLAILNLEYENINGEKLIGKWNAQNMEGKVIVSKSK